MELKKLDMIMFDYHNTLVAEPDWSAESGNKALMKYITRNPRGCTYEDIIAQYHAVFSEISRVRRSLGYEISGVAGSKLVYEGLGIGLSLTDSELEQVFWNAASRGKVLPFVEEMLKYLRSAGIRTAVISNNAWSGRALRARLDRLLPENVFEFHISSCDYMVRKPDRRLFEAALSKAGLSADRVWYCGDVFEKDVVGAHGAGMFPVLYGCVERAADFDFLKINDWRELIALLKNLSV